MCIQFSWTNYTFVYFISALSCLCWMNNETFMLLMFATHPTLGLSWALATEQPKLYFFLSTRPFVKLAVCCVFLLNVDFQTLILIGFQTRMSSTTSSGFTCLIFNLFIYMHFSSVISEFKKTLFVKWAYILSRHFRKAFLAYFSFIVCF